MPPESESKEKEKMKLAYADRSNHVWMQWTEIQLLACFCKYVAECLPGNQQWVRVWRRVKLAIWCSIFSWCGSVCGCASSFVHVTVAPMLTWTGLGEKASVFRLEEQRTMETETEAPWFCSCNCGGCCLGGIGIGGDEVVLASVKVLLSMLVPPLPSGAEVKVKLLCMSSNLFKGQIQVPTYM